MVRYCLRYQLMDIALPDGDFIVGRVPECDLVLDDGLVSRRHARFRVSNQSVEVEDLGSRNGVMVNARPVDGPVRLKVGDQVRIGSQNLLLKANKSAKLDMGTRELRICEACQVPVAFDSPCPHCGRGPDDFGKPHGPSFDVLAKIAEKAVGLGRLAEAERILNSMYESLLSQGRTSAVKDSDVLIACDGALRLAEATGRGTWLDYPLNLHHELGRVVPPATIDALYQLAGRLRYNNPTQIRNYVSWLKQRADQLDAPQRFSLSRLEGLERMLASH
ncbi:MAG: FHA domain-containing protein [Myxococcales bacterium]|nr:FHA domain-containing protein [Myxococcales bacterium]MDD9966945.1 FHA domain-containing protein [Myxococcales bacterium]